MKPNPPELPGKRTGEQTLHGKATQFSFGDENLKGAASTTKAAFGGFEGQKLERTQRCEPHKSQV